MVLRKFIPAAAQAAGVARAGTKRGTCRVIRSPARVAMAALALFGSGSGAWPPSAVVAPSIGHRAETSLLRPTVSLHLEPCADVDERETPCDPANVRPIPQRDRSMVGSLGPRTFEVRMFDDIHASRRHCWVFGDADGVVTVDGDQFRWAPYGAGPGSVGFQLVGSPGYGRSVGYHGTLVASDLLFVNGIEIVGTRTMTTVGLGRAVSSCVSSSDT